MNDVTLTDEAAALLEKYKTSPNVSDVDVRGVDEIDNTKKEENPAPFLSTVPEEQKKESNTFDFKTPVEIVAMFDDDILEGRMTLHNWQIQFLVDFSIGGTSKDQPFLAALRAANGSGKDKYIIAPCAVWLGMAFSSSTCVITSSSGIQLDRQTMHYIKRLCENVNRYCGFEVWKINYRHFTCTVTNSELILFATDEAGKAEGYHPKTFNAKMALLESEAKTVSDDIFNAQTRCKGFTHRVLVSSTGNESGHFYDCCSSSVPRSSLKSVLDITPFEWIGYKVTSYDCSHISKREIEKDAETLPGGVSGILFRSIHLAEFTSADSSTVIQSVVGCVEGKTDVKWVKEGFPKAGVDISLGGDETVIQVRDGNKHLHQFAFRFSDAPTVESMLDKKFREFGLNNPNSVIFADAGGIGRPILDHLKELGWLNIRYVVNQGIPRDKRVWKNKGTEMWFNLRELFARRQIIVKNDAPLIKQLTNRKYKLLLGGTVHQVLAKDEEKNLGSSSPDRADALCLCYSDYLYDKTIKSVNDIPFPSDEFYKNRNLGHEIMPKFDFRVWCKENKNSSLPHIRKMGKFSKQEILEELESYKSV